MKQFVEFLADEDTAWIGFMVASPAYVVCRLTHYCMGGHLRHCDDPTHSHSFAFGVAIDTFWRAAFAWAVVRTFTSGIRFKYSLGFALGTGFLFIANLQNLAGIIMFPLHAALCLFALACLKDWID